VAQVEAAGEVAVAVEQGSAAEVQADGAQEEAKAPDPHEAGAAEAPECEGATTAPHVDTAPAPPKEESELSQKLNEMTEEMARLCKSPRSPSEGALEEDAYEPYISPIYDATAAIDAGTDAKPSTGTDEGSRNTLESYVDSQLKTDPVRSPRKGGARKPKSLEDFAAEAQQMSGSYRKPPSGVTPQKVPAAAKDKADGEAWFERYMETSKAQEEAKRAKEAVEAKLKSPKKGRSMAEWAAEAETGGKPKPKPSPARKQKFDDELVIPPRPKPPGSRSRPTGSIDQWAKKDAKRS